MSLNSAEWVAERREYVGASDLPIILGESPYRSEYELALQKRGLTEPEPQNEAQAWGHRVQWLALDLYPDLTGRKVRHIHSTLRAKGYPHVRASLDGRVIGEKRGVEVKLTRAWDELPRHVVIQCQGQMGVCGLDAVDVMRVGMGYRAPAIFTIERDDALIGDLLPMAEAWYVRYVLGDGLPPVDGSRGASRYLDRTLGPPEMVASDEQTTLARQLAATRALLERSEGDERLLVNRLKESMAGAESMRGPGFRVTWKPTKERQSVDWRGVALEMGASPVLVERHTTTQEGSRPFRVTFTEEREEAVA